EVARAVAGALARAGVEVGEGGTPVQGRIDAVDAEQVRLVATVAGRSVEVQGLLERVDVLAGELATKLVPVVPVATRHAPPPPTRMSLPPAHGAKRVAAATTGRA